MIYPTSMTQTPRHVARCHGRCEGEAADANAANVCAGPLVDRHDVEKCLLVTFGFGKKIEEEFVVARNERGYARVVRPAVRILGKWRLLRRWSDRGGRCRFGVLCEELLCVGLLCDGLLCDGLLCDGLL